MSSGVRVPSEFAVHTVENTIPNQSVTAVAPGSWAYVQRGQPNEESDYESKCRCQEYPNDGKNRGSGMVAEVKMEVRKAHDSHTLRALPLWEL